MKAKLTIYTYSKCSTCKKALKWLDEKNIQYLNKSIVDNPPSKEEIMEAHKYMNNRKLLFNTSGKSYRSIGSKVINAMSDETAIEELAKDGKLIKRPFVITSDNEYLTGFKEIIWDKLLI
tara:strand:+ start:26 stop:385 length:360 start_codon:yes stop_codon:yes gene_type:complete